MSHRVAHSETGVTRKPLESEIEDPEDAPTLLWCAGLNGIARPFDWHGKSRRLRLRVKDLDQDETETEVEVKKAYDPNEARDSHGRWTASDADKKAALEKLEALPLDEGHEWNMPWHDKILHLKEAPWSQPPTKLHTFPKHTEEDLIERGKVEEVPLDGTIHRTQSWMSPVGVRAYINGQGHNEDKLPIIIRDPDGSLYVAAGHTRLTTAYLFGRKTTPATVVDVDEKGRPKRVARVRKALDGIPVGDLALGVLAGTQGHWLPLLKKVDIVKLAPGQKLSAADMKAMKLTWITAHPNGPGTEPAVPLIVHDNGDHYVVVGGAGGKLNQMTLQKSGERSDLKKQAKAQSKEGAEKAAAEDPEGFQKLKDAAKLYKAKSKEALSEHVNTALEKLGGSMDAIKAEARKQAEAKAKAELPDATPEEVEKFAQEAEKAAEGQAKKAVEGALQTALDAVAKAEINQEALTATDIEATVGGKSLVKKLSPDEIKDLIDSAINVDKLKTAEAAVKKALKTGTTDALEGIQAFLQETAPTDQEVAQWAKDGYLQQQAIKDNVAIVQESQLASKGAQEKHQSFGAADALNSVAGTMTGAGAFTPEQVQYLGIENAARVLAAHLTRTHKVDGQKFAEKLGERLANDTDVHIAASLAEGAKMDALAQAAIDAAESGKGVVTMAQALIMTENQKARKFELYNLTRGHCQSAAHLYWNLSHDSQKEMVLKGGETEVATKIKAKSLGLEQDDFTVEPVKGEGFQIKVNGASIHKLVSQVTPLQAERARQVAEIKQEAVQGGDGSWQPSTGWQDGTETDADGNKKLVTLAPHQIAAAKAILEHKKMILNYGAGSGKTAIYYSAGAELLASGKVKRGLITMPAKPRSQQEDYTETHPTTGKKTKKEGEKTKFLTKDMADKFTVVKSTAHLQKLLAENPDRVLIMSPEMMRDHAETLKKAGFGGKDSFTFVDEAHEAAIGVQDKHGDVEGSGKSRAVQEMVKGSAYATMGSGTLVENSGSELHSLLSTIDPTAFSEKDKAAFSARWDRIASQTKGPMRQEILQSLASEVGGYMLHYHTDPTDKAGKPITLNARKQELDLTPEQEEQIVAANKQREEDEKSQDPNVRTAAALRWAGSVMRASIGPPMFDHISNYVEERRKKDPSYKAVVWSQELLPIKELESRLGKHGKVVTITGSKNDKETKAAIDSFQNDPDVVAVVVSNAANFGVNLQAGHSVIKCGFPPVPSKDEQLDARIFRRGQDKDVESITYLAKHPLVQAAYSTLHDQKGKAMGLLSDLADDSILGAALTHAGAGKATQVTKALLLALGLVHRWK